MRHRLWRISALVMATFCTVMSLAVTMTWAAAIPGEKEYAGMYQLFRYIDLGESSAASYISSRQPLSFPEYVYTREQPRKKAREIIWPNEKQFPAYGQEGPWNGVGKAGTVLVPLAPDQRNLIQVTLYRDGDTGTTGSILLNGQWATSWAGPGWYVAEMVVENDSRTEAELTILCFPRTFVSSIKVWIAGIEPIKLPQMNRAWNSQLGDSYIEVADNGRYFVRTDGVPFYPIGITGGSGYSPEQWISTYEQQKADEYFRIISPYSNITKWHCWVNELAPELGSVNQPRIEEIDERLAIWRYYGMRVVFDTTDRVGGEKTRPASFAVESTNPEHQLWWSSYLATRYKNESAIMTWGVSNEEYSRDNTAFGLRHKLVAQAMQAQDSNHLIGADIHGNADTQYSHNADQGNIVAVGNDPTIGWLALHAYKPLDSTIISHKFNTAFGKPAMLLEFDMPLDISDPYSTIPNQGRYITDAEGTWSDRFLHAILDGMAGISPWYMGITPPVLNVLGAMRKLVDRIDWAHFTPTASIAVQLDEPADILKPGVRNALLLLSKQEGLPVDVRIGKVNTDDYALVIKDDKDLSTADLATYRKVSANGWNKYLLARENNQLLIWVKSTMPPQIYFHQDMAIGSYLVEWLDVKTGNLVALTETNITANTVLNAPIAGEYLVYIHARQPVSVAWDEFLLVNKGAPSAVIIGPDDVPFGTVSFVRQQPIEIYSALKEVVEKSRLASGATIRLAAPDEIAQLPSIETNIVIVGSAEQNSWRKYLASVIDVTPQGCYQVIINPWHPHLRIMLVNGSNPELLKTVQALTRTLTYQQY